ncbi:MAG: aminoacyl-tRNA hydrolase [Candidatus Omnitrophica bacterium]|nr:aminoacyl-tRNA hydrolase [Candidatus Omnitrophota bacterium]
MKILFGLGNPGKRYKNNRHNIGYMIVDKLAEDLRISFKKSLLLAASLVRSKVSGQEILLVKPMGFMNNSGLSVKKVLKKYRSRIDDILIIYDDADLSMGEVRLRKKGSAAGHNGMHSVIEALNTNQINRLRIGISKPESEKADLSGYVLSDFDSKDNELLQQVLETARSASLDWIKKGEEFVMQKYNRSKPSP